MKAIERYHLLLKEKQVTQNATPKNIDRRRFLRNSSLLLAASLLPATFNSCSKWKKSSFRFSNAKYNTIGHEVLFIELAHNQSGEYGDDYYLLDFIIDVASKRIASLGRIREDNKQHALAVFKSIDQTLKDCGFTYGDLNILNEGLHARKMNCDCYSSVYLSVGDELGLPIQMVRAPGHTFIRWQLDEDNFVNWETTIGEEKKNAYYIRRFKIPLETIGNSALRGLNLTEDRENILANAYVNSGAVWMRKGATQKAIDDFVSAINRAPLFDTPYFNIGLAYYKLGQIHKAVSFCKQTLFINPNHLRAHSLLYFAYADLGEVMKSKSHKRKVLWLDENYFSRSI